MSYGTILYGANEYGRTGLVDKAHDRAFGGAVYGTQIYGFSESQEGSITGDAIGIGGGSTVGSVGTYAILTAAIGIEGTASGLVTLTGLASGDISIGGDVLAVLSHDGQVTGDAIGISGSAIGQIVLSGEITGDAIGIEGQAFGGTSISYDKVGARLLTQVASGRFITGTVRGRFTNNTVKGRF